MVEREIYYPTLTVTGDLHDCYVWNEWKYFPMRLEPGPSATRRYLDLKHQLIVYGLFRKKELVVCSNNCLFTPTLWYKYQPIHTFGKIWVNLKAYILVSYTATFTAFNE